jgi:hypothetical protein
MRAFYAFKRFLTLTGAVASSALFIYCGNDPSPVSPGNSPPKAPHLPHPADGALYEREYLALSWECSDPDGDRVLYDVKVMEQGEVIVFWEWTYEKSMETDLALFRETAYTWTVTATDGLELSESAEWSFHTPAWSNEPPYAPSDPWPQDGAADIRTGGPDLTWSAGDPDTDDVLSFDLYFGTEDAPGRAAAGLDQTSYTLPVLDSGTTYFWRIVSTDSHGASTSGPVWSFTTRDRSSGD